MIDGKEFAVAPLLLGSGVIRLLLGAAIDVADWAIAPVADAVWHRFACVVIPTDRHIFREEDLTV